MPYEATLSHKIISHYLNLMYINDIVMTPINYFRIIALDCYETTQYTEFHIDLFEVNLINEPAAKIIFTFCVPCLWPLLQDDYC